MFHKQCEARERILKEVNESTIEVLKDEVAFWRDQTAEQNDALKSLEDAHRALLEVHRLQSERLDKAYEELAQREKVVELAPVAWNANVPIHVPEEESEARWLRDQGLISEEDLKKILDEIGYQNTEVEGF